MLVLRAALAANRFQPLHRQLPKFRQSGSSFLQERETDYVELDDAPVQIADFRDLLHRKQKAVLRSGNQASRLHFLETAAVAA